MIRGLHISLRWAEKGQTVRPPVSFRVVDLHVKGLPVRLSSLGNDALPAQLKSVKRGLDRYDLHVPETYTSGVWTVKPGEEGDFVEAWKEFVAWAAEMPGSGTFRLVRDLEQTGRFMSFAPWESFEAQDAWKQQPEFAERINRVRVHCEDFHPHTYEFVTDVS